MKEIFKRSLLFAVLLSLLVLAACGGDETEDGDTATDTDEEATENYSEAVNYTITAIEPGAGISVATENAIEEYEQLEGWDVELSSTAAMLAELDGAISNEEPIIVTGWNPHWMFVEHPELKYIDDPLEIYGGEETINTLVRTELEEDMPEAYQILDQFNWDIEDMESIMYEAQETGEDIETIAERWVEENDDKVSTWLDGVEEVDGESFELASIQWDSEIASSSVLRAAMEQKGFDVTVTPVDVAIIFEAVANNDADATIAAWLPYTHKDFYENYEEEFEDLGPNLTGAKIGLSVPDYMDIDSIEDLEPR